MKKALLIAAILAFAVPAVADESIQLRPCWDSARVEATQVDALEATWNIDVSLCHQHADVWILAATGTSVDWEIKACTNLAGTITCKALVPAVSGTLAAGASQLVLIDRPIELMRVELTTNDCDVDVKVVGSR